MRRQQVLGRARSDAGKHRAPAGQVYLAGPAEMERVVADRKKQPEHLGAANDRERAARRAECLPGLLETGARRIPPHRLVVLRIRRKRRNTPGEDQPPPLRRARVGLLRMAAVGDRARTIERAMEEALVGLDLERVRHHALDVGDHAVGGDDRVAFDAERAGHGGQEIFHHIRCDRRSALRRPFRSVLGAASLYLLSPRSKTPHPAEGIPAFDGVRVRSAEPNAARYADYCFWPGWAPEVPPAGPLLDPPV